MIKEKAMNNLKLLEVSESSQVTQVVKEVYKFPIVHVIPGLYFLEQVS